MVGERKLVKGLGITLSSLLSSLSLLLSLLLWWVWASWSLESEKPSQVSESLESLESRELTVGAVRKAGLEDRISMALSIEPPRREVCPVLAGILTIATDGNGWTCKYAGVIPRP